MGTLYDQTPRESHHVTKEDLDSYLTQVVNIAKKHKISVADVVAAAHVLELERANKLQVRNGDTFDEQMAGLGKELKQLSELQASKGERNQMSFKDLERDMVKVVLKDGTVYTDVRASVQLEKIFTQRVDIPLTEGSFFVRTLPNGIEETYEVLNTGYSAGMSGRATGIPAMFQARVRKITEIPRVVQQSHTYNLHGANSRVNISSEDNSLNISIENPGKLLDDLKELVLKEVKDATKLEEIQASIEEMRNAKNQTTFSKAYGKFLASAADHIGVFQPLVTGLMILLQNLPPS
jgi:hypothetical protein